MGEAISNYTDETIQDLIKGFPLSPTFTRVIITLNREEVEGEVIMNDNPLSEIQYVVSTGSSAQVKPGQKILLDLNKLTVKIPHPEDSNQMIESIKIDPIKVGNETFAIIYDNQIKAIYN